MSRFFDLFVFVFLLKGLFEQNKNIQAPLFGEDF